MPPYDPKANRPKLVPVETDVTPVDALLGSVPSDAATPLRHLSVVSSVDAAPDATTSAAPHAAPAVAPSPSPSPSLRLDRGPKVLVAAAALATAIVVMLVLRRRGN